ncbi:MAG: GNAT family N-acetyltransferase [Planctomycetota bacterium]
MIRRARADEVDAAAYTHLMNEAGDDIFRLVFGPDWMRPLSEAYLVKEHVLSYQYVWFAERDGLVVGMVMCFSAEALKISKNPGVTWATGLRLLRLCGWLLAMWPLVRFMGKVPDGDYYVQGLAVEPSARGGSIGSLLLNHTEVQARKRGSRRLALDVAVENEGAQRLYARRGMREEGRSPQFFGIPRVIRVVKELDD